MMSQHKELVEYRKKVLNAEIWAKKVCTLQMTANKNGTKIWETKYNDGSLMTEYWNSDNLVEKTIKTNPTLTIDDCIDQMAREEADANF
tara:strand:- start:2680 stop:2946 length:267 start_codon:yes stop_codon:yes gene_type:complete